MKGPAVFMYVDDTTLVDVVGMEAAALHLTTGTTKAHMGQLALEGDFVELDRRAEAIKMKINAKKTQLLAIAPPNGFATSASIQAGGQCINSVDTLRLVGFTFGRKPGAEAHLSATVDKI